MSHHFSEIKDAVLWAASFLSGKGVENGRLEAELLMAMSMGTDRTHVLMNLRSPLPDGTRQYYLHLVHRRGERFPLQYITQRQEFMTLPFSVREGVLIPREDTEVLVEAVLNLDIPFENVLDVGTGSGIISVSIARQLPNCAVTAIDISARALDLAAENAQALGVGDRITFVCADIFEWNSDLEYDLIVSNPPYIPSSELEELQKEVQFEPSEALDGGERGLDFYFRLADLATKCLKSDGVLGVEIGWQQASDVAEIFNESGMRDITVLSDYCGRDRVILCRKGQG